MVAQTFLWSAQKKDPQTKDRKKDGAKDVGIIGDRVKKQERHRRASLPVPLFYLEFSQISLRICF